MNTSENLMGTKKITPLLLSMSIPPMISMMIQALYNIVDSIFVARLSPDALTAVSLAFPMQNLVLALSVGFGIGLNACIARRLGSKNYKAVEQTATHGFLLTALHSILFMLIGIFVTKPFLSIFAQNESILNMSCSYTYIVIICSFGQLFHLYAEKIFQATGNMITPMFIQGLGAIINIILDPILIFGLFGFPAMGIAGAAIATVTAQIISCGVSFILFFQKKNPVKINFKGFKFSTDIIKSIYTIAIPSSLMIALPSVLVGILNGILIGLSDFGVGVFGIYNKLQTFIVMPAGGVIQGLRPIMSYNYGAKNYKRMRESVKSALTITGIIMFFGTLLFLAFPKQIISLFNDDPEILRVGVSALRIISIGFVVSTISIVLCGAFEALGHGMLSLKVSLLKSLLIIPPAAFIFSRFIGLYGVWIAFPLAELIASVAAIILYRKFSKEIYSNN
ncbi:MAG: MATE family efflux transporter [Clostridium sp.]